MFPSLLQDARYALRTLLKHPGFTIVAVLSLAIGIGLNSAIFTVVDNVLFRPMPVDRPDTLATVFTSSENGDRYATSSYPDLEDMRASNTVFTEMVGHTMMFAAVGLNGENRLAFGEVVTVNFFSVLGIHPAMGRGFLPEEEHGEGAHPVALVSDRLWKTSFGGRADVVGRTFTMKNRAYTIVGVAPPEFNGLMPGVVADLWIPITMVGDVEPAGMNDIVPSATGTTRMTRRGARWLFIKARLRPGVSTDAAEANLQSVMTRLEEAYPVSNRQRRATVLPAASVRFVPMIDQNLRPAGIVLMAAVGLVLLVACANLASMLLARGAARTREMALRAAMGASRTRLIRQLAVESLVLAAFGGAAGLLLAMYAISWLVSARLPFELPISFTLAIDWRMVLFTGTLSLVTGLLFGVLPALGASRPDLVPALKDAGSLAAPGRRFGLRHALVVVQVAVSVVLLVGGLLLTRSLLASFDTNPGFEPRGLVSTTISLDMHGYDEAGAKQFLERAVARTRQLPGVQSVALAERLPFSPNIQTTQIVIEGRPDATPASGVSVDVTRVTPEYFQTLGVPLMEGRRFDARDTPESMRVAIVSEALAAKYFPNGHAIGGRMRLRDHSGPVVEIIGVSRDYKVRTIGEAPRPLIHFASSQRSSTSASILTRTAGDSSQLVHMIEREFRQLEPNLVFLELGSVDRMIATSLLPISLGASLFGGLAGLAMLLAGLGLYGVIAFSVARRTREIGIRMALGSTRGLVLRQILREAMVLVSLGTLAGAVLAGLGAQALSGVLHGVTPHDPLSYVGAAALLFTTAIVASLIPARRAASVDPLVALRSL